MTSIFFIIQTLTILKYISFPLIAPCLPNLSLFIEILQVATSIDITQHDHKL